MKVAAVMLAAGAALLAMSVLGSSRDSHPQPCGPRCWNAISRALWAAWNTLDCDSGLDQLDTSCNDDMQNVNQAARILSVKPGAAGDLVIRLTITERNPNPQPTPGLIDRFAYVVHPNGVVVPATADSDG